MQKSFVETYKKIQWFVDRFEEKYGLGFSV